MPKQEEKLSVWIRLAYGSGDFYGGAIAAPIAFLACGFYFGWKFPITPGRFARIQKWLELKRQNSLHQLEPGELAVLVEAVEEAAGSKSTERGVADAPSA